MSWLPRWCFKYVKEAWIDDDGFWVQLKEGYIFGNEGTTVISQDTFAELYEQLLTIKKA